MILLSLIFTVDIAVFGTAPDSCDANSATRTLASGLRALLDTTARAIDDQENSP